MRVWRWMWERVAAWYEKRPAWCRWIPAVVWMAVIFYLSAQPQLPRLPSPFWNDFMSMGAHMLEYAILGALVWFALGRRMPLLAWGLAVAYAISDEFHQRFVPGRHADPVDVLIDTVGAGLAVALLWWWERARSQGSRQARREERGR
jgi:VanZ family protein